MGFFTITTHHHTNPYNPSKSTSGVSWRLPDTAVLLPGLGSISKMLSSLTLYQFYILHCVYIERKKDKGEEKIMASCIRGGEIKRRSSRSLSKFRLTLHPLSLIPSSARAGRVLGKFLTIVRFKYLWKGL